MRWRCLYNGAIYTIMAAPGYEEVMSMSKVVFAFFFVIGLVLLYLNILVEHQFVIAGVCP